MASFTNRGTKKKPSWQFTVSRMVNGKSKPIRKGGFKTKKEAEAAAREVELMLQKGVHPDLRDYAFDEYFESWIKAYKTDISDNTLARYKDTLRTIEEYFQGVSIKKINKRSYQEFLNEYGKTHAKSSTQKLNTHIRACVKDAIDEGIIAVDFTRGAKISGTPSKPKHEKHLNYEESKKLLKRLYELDKKTPTHYLLILGLTSGMRFGEMVGLTRKDFDFKNNTITINKTWGYTKQMHEGFGPTKNPQSNRTIKMDIKTMNLFKKYFEETPDNILRLVFYSPHSKYKVVTNNTANKVLKYHLEQMKIKTISVHGLRHTHASVSLYEGASIHYISERLGHETIDTTLREYTHVIRELRLRDEEKISNIFGKMYV